MLTISDGLNHQLQVFSIEPWDARQTVTRADSQSTVSMRGLTVSVTCRYHEGRTLIAIVQTKAGGVRTIQSVFPVPESVHQGPDPLDTLTALCEKYGMPVRVDQDPGVEVSTLIISDRAAGSRDQFLRSTERYMRTMQIPGHEYCFTAFVVDAGEYTEIALLFILDVTALASDMTSVDTIDP